MKTKTLLACGHSETGTPVKLPHHHATGLYCDACEAGNINKFAKGGVL